MRLTQNFLRNQRFVVGNHSAGIDNFHGAATPFGFAIDAIAGDAGLVGDDGASRAGKSIEERGFADIRAAYNYQRWKSLRHRVRFLRARRRSRGVHSTVTESWG